eukprot:GHVR01110994.1.p1 GENE.GHVR01110994.1~~GHVR01110994.1.p1  ORF type:complete len:430 (+),score=16.29 GHVR01110994.1:40-1329(+)
MTDQPMCDASPMPQTASVKSPNASEVLSGGRAKMLFEKFVVEQENKLGFQADFNKDLNSDELNLRLKLKDVISTTNDTVLSHTKFQFEVCRILEEWIKNQWNRKDGIEISGNVTDIMKGLGTQLFGNCSSNHGDRFIINSVLRTIQGSIEYKSETGIHKDGINAAYQCLGYVVLTELPAWLNRYNVIGNPVMIVLSPTQCYIVSFGIPPFMSADSFTLTYAPFNFVDDNAVRYILAFLKNSENNTQIHTGLSTFRRDSLLGVGVPFGPRLVHPGLSVDGRVLVNHGVLLFCNEVQFIQIEKEIYEVGAETYEVGGVAGTNKFVVKVVSNFYGLHCGKLAGSHERGDSLLKLLNQLQEATGSYDTKKNKPVIPIWFRDARRDLTLNVTEFIYYRRELTKILKRTLCKVRFSIVLCSCLLCSGLQSGVGML